MSLLKTNICMPPCVDRLQHHPALRTPTPEEANHHKLEELLAAGAGKWDVNRCWNRQSYRQVVDSGRLCIVQAALYDCFRPFREHVHVWPSEAMARTPHLGVSALSPSALSVGGLVSPGSAAGVRKFSGFRIESIDRVEPNNAD
jgi:hypothetical protein